MPGRLILEINGTPVAVVPIKLTAAQIRAVVRRFAKAQNVVVEGKTEVEIGEAALRRVLRWLKANSERVQRDTEVAARMADIEALVAADNDLYDEIETVPPLGQP